MITQGRITSYNVCYTKLLRHYLYELYILNFIGFVIWALLSLFVQILIGNPYLGLFVMLVISIGIPFLSFAGIEQAIFKYNQAPGFQYSDMNGYGTTFSPYISHKLYWLFCGLLLLCVAALFWVRGLPNSFKERYNITKSRSYNFV